MFVLCPHCQFLVALEPATGQPPERCPRCRERLQPILEASPAVPSGEPDDDLETTAAANIETALVADVMVDVVDVIDVPSDAIDVPEPLSDAQASLPAIVDIAPPAVAHGAADAGSDSDVAGAAPAIAAAAATPRVSRSSRLPSATARRRLAIASVPLLAIVLLLQSLLSDRTRLAADTRWRPLMTVLCDMLPCTLPPWHEPAAFTLLERDVRPDPRRPGVLHVSAGFRNDARWAQPWPALLLTLSDADGRVAGARAFRPDEYLAPGVTKNGLASGQSAKVSFDVIEPTRDVVAFTFDFR